MRVSEGIFDWFKKKEKTKGDGHNLKVALPDWKQFDGPIKNQRSCGSCWAFAALGAIEGNYNKLKGKYTPFSEQYLVDCDNIDGGCQGGWPTNTLNWINDNGILHQDHLPYKAVQGACDANNKAYEYKIVKGFKMHYEENASYSHGTFEELLNAGPLIVGMDASFQGFGQYRPTTFEPLNPVGCGQ